MLVRGGPPHLRNLSGNLSTEKARRFIQSKVDQALQSQRPPSVYGEVVEIARSMSGPATKLNVRWKREILSIDIVICLQASDIGDENGFPYHYDMVAKPYDEYHCNRDGIWRISYSKQEVEALRNCNERQRVLLRIMKVVKNHQPQLNRFPSYFYKNVLFRLKDDDPWASWERKDLPQRFKDMIKTIRDCLRNAYLPLHFNNDVNYLEGKSDLSSVATYLTNVINGRRYIELLARVPLHAPEIDDAIQGLANLRFDEPRVYDVDQQRAENRSGWSCCVM